jgi:hypothetical protein
MVLLDRHITQTDPHTDTFCYKIYISTIGGNVKSMYQGKKLLSTPGRRRETILKCILEKYFLI